MDFQATTPLDPAVRAAMLPWLDGRLFGNPHSRAHAYGWQAEEAVEIAREQIAALIGAEAREIIFTSGATEANNLAIKGVARNSSKKHLLTIATEHPCVLESFRRLEREGFRLTILPVQSDGLVDLALLQESLTDDTLLLSVMAVNNEIGVIQPLAEIGALCRARGVLFHCDAAQAFGKNPLDVNAMQIDLLSLSGHKIYGPQGVGALYVRRRPRVALLPELDGGGQERGLRSGTVPVMLAVGLGAAADVAARTMEADRIQAQAFFDLFVQATADVLPGVVLHGHRTQRWPGNVNLGFANTNPGAVLMALKKLAVSSGSACASGSDQPSHVLQALGVPAEPQYNAIRFGFGRTTTKADVLMAIEEVVQAVERTQLQRLG
jgi:cysteine desulfurase